MNVPASAPGGFRRVVRHFAPSWFAAVMGTGVVSITSFHYGETYPLLRSVGTWLHGLNLVLFVLLFVPWTLRWLMERQAAVAALRHPIMGQFYATFGIALLVLAGECLLYGHPLALSATLWGLGVIFSVLFSFAAFWLQFHGQQMELEHVTPGMFIPPVGLVVVPLAGQALLPQVPAGWRELILVANVASLGAGSFLWLGLMALTVHRFVLAKRLPGMLLPTIWINLGPIGVVSLDLIALAQGLPLPGARETLPVLALMLWGFGLWWFAMALLITLAYWRRGELPFSLAWWAFTFPLGAYAAASHRLGSLFGLESVWAIGFAAYLVLLVLWTAAFLGSLRGVVSGKLFLDPPAPSPSAAP
ncbi:tellurite-resistance/dicarboxylate transporter [Thiobacter aerophilum]|uniref:Tellurite-resistance/dicarboxylate transporter n=1 Tax=Thiobacter aerophilum TaxID=3121275 RepID=A0ABV0ECN3_9BURK